MVTAPSPSAKKSRIKFDFTVDELQEYAYYRQDDAAKAMGVASITLKRICKRRDYRWPYRTNKAKLRREARIAAQLQAREASARPTKTLPPPPHPKPLSSNSPPEMLLLLRTERKAHDSPTSVSGLQSPMSTVDVHAQRHQMPVTSARRSPVARFRLDNRPTQPNTQVLPDFASFIRLLAQQKSLSPQVSPPHLNGVVNKRPMHHHPIAHKTSATSFVLPKFNGRLSQLADHSTSQTQQRLPPAKLLLSGHSHGCYQCNN